MTSTTQANANTPSCADDGERGSERLPAHVTLLINFVAPYALPVYQELARRVERLSILVSTPMESNRTWEADWSGLEVHIQNTSTWRMPVRHPLQFNERLHVHIPWDTFGQLRRLRPDVILSTELGARSLLAALYKNTHHTPLVIAAGLSEHTELGRGRPRLALRRWLARRADAVVVNGSSGSRYLQSIGFRPDSIFRIPYTHLPDCFDRLPVEREPSAARRLLYVGDLIERKGIMPFLAALARWGMQHPEQKVEFWLVGGGELAGAIADFPAPQNVTVRLLGRRAYDELPELYHQCGIFAFPTLSDEWGLVVNEALASGMPVLGSRYGQAVEDLCVEGETGWQFRTDHTDEMAAAIDRALNVTPQALEAMRAPARARVADITPSRTAGMWVDVIQSVLSRRSKA